MGGGGVASALVRARGIPVTTRLYCLWVLSAMLAFMLEFLSSRALTLMMPY